MTLDQMLELLKKGAETNLMLHNTVAPVFAVFHGKNGADFISPNFANDAMKERSAELIRKHIEQVKAYAVGQVSEAYMVHADGDQARAELTAAMANGVRASNHPQRVEVLIVRIEDRMGVVKTSTAAIVRQHLGDEASKGTLQPWVDLSDTIAGSCGRLTDWFRPTGLVH